MGTERVSDSISPEQAFSAGGNDVSKSLQPIKETVVSMLQLQSDRVEAKVEILTGTETREEGQACKLDTSEENDKAPSIPQLVKGGRSIDDGCSQDPPNGLKVEGTSDSAIDLTEVRENSHSNSELVDNTTNNLTDSSKEVMKSNHTEDVAEEEVTSDNGSKTDECSSIKDSCLPSSQARIGDNGELCVENPKKKNLFLRNSLSHCKKSNQKKSKVRTKFN